MIAYYQGYFATDPDTKDGEIVHLENKGHELHFKIQFVDDFDDTNIDTEVLESMHEKYVSNSWEDAYILPIYRGSRL